MPGVTFRGNTRSQPAWAKDFGGREHISAIPGKVDPTQFTDGKAIVVTLTADKAAASTTLAVTALAYPSGYVPTVISTTASIIPAGTVLDFGGGKFAVTTADAAVGATSISVRATPTDMVTGDTARYSRYGVKYLNSGTLLGRTFAERDASTPFGPAVYTDDEFFILYFDTADLSVNTDVELYRPGSQVAENYLPDWTAISGNANLLAKLRSVYQCIKGYN